MIEQLCKLLIEIKEHEAAATTLFTARDFFTVSPYDESNTPVEALLLPCVAKDIANAKVAAARTGIPRIIQALEAALESVLYTQRRIESELHPLVTAVPGNDMHYHAVLRMLKEDADRALAETVAALKGSFFP